MQKLRIMNHEGEKFVKFAEWHSETSSTSEQQNLHIDGSNQKTTRPSFSSLLKNIQDGVARFFRRITKFRKPTRVYAANKNSCPANKLVSRKKVFDPQGPLLRKWNKIFVISCVIAVSVDPLFFYIPVIDYKYRCLDLDGTLQITACVLRTFFDLFYVLHIIFQFRTGFIAPSSRVFGRGELIDEPLAVAKRYLSSYFVVDILSILPLPQVLLLAIIPNLSGSVPSPTKDLLECTIFIQYVPRLIRIIPLSKEVVRTSGILTETAWAGAVFNLFLYMLASHVAGALWYLFSVESELRCWRRTLHSASLHHVGLNCGIQKSTAIALLANSCPFTDPDDIKDNSVFNFGIYVEALKSGVTNSTIDFPTKFFFSFWWGLRNLSSLGQNLKTSTYVWEIIFAIFISIFGLVLFALLIGNMQKYLQSTTVRVEEMRVKRRDAEQWMSHRMLPETLRERIRRYEHYKWQENRGVEEEFLIRNLPKDLRRDIKRHLCLDLLMRVPLFEKMDEQLLDALCERLKPVLYTEKSVILREGEPVDEMQFIMRGSLATMTTNGGRTGFFNSATLKAGDFCGEELLTWALDPNSFSHLPASTRTVEALTEVEAFALTSNDLKFVASRFRRLHSKQLQHTFKFYSLQWRTWAACFIQIAWRCYCKRKLDKSMREAEKKLQDALAKGGGTTSLSLGATVYASRFATNALRTLRQNTAPNTRVSPRLLPLLPQKPTEPDFTKE